MLVTKTPLRISFFGGGSDIPQFYQTHDGMVLSTTIDKHIYIAANISVARHIKLVYSEMEYPASVSEIKHDRIRSILQHFGITNNIEIASFSDVPTKGTGLGSSSTFTVGVLHALFAQLRLPFNKRDLAELACEIEIDKCGEPIGKQDQYAATYGGLNVIRFTKDRTTVSPLPITSDVLHRLQQNLFIYDTKITRQAASILSDHVKNLTTNATIIEATCRMVDLTKQSVDYLLHEDLDSFGTLLHTAWTIKKNLATNISNPVIDALYDAAMHAGALGGKLLGAGGGGYMLFYVPKERHEKFIAAMASYDRFPFQFVEYGSTVEMSS